MRFSLISALLLLCLSCVPNNPEKPDVPDNPEVPADSADTAPFFAKGADISWVTEMEAKGYKFYNAAGEERECTALLKEIGFNAVRYRVWVNPKNGYNSAEDVLRKALRAQALGMKILIDNDILRADDSVYRDKLTKSAVTQIKGFIQEQFDALIPQIREIMENPVDGVWLREETE